jgi:hypothetical protein
MRKVRMRGITKLTYIAIAGVVLLSLAVTPAWSVTYGKLSKNHTLYGVSQFLAGGVSPIGKILVKLVNPTPVTMVAVALFYEREGGNHGGVPAQFLRCVVEKLYPHAAIQIENKTECASNSSKNPNCVPQYVEVISVPVEPVQAKKNGTTRLADGLGIVGSPNNFQGNLFLLNPELFSLPSNDAVPGQREVPIDSICTALQNKLQDKELSPDLFEEFGIFCP